MKKIKLFVLSFIVLMFSMVNVKAEEYSDAYKKITTDGTLTIKSVKPETEIEMELFVIEGVKKALGTYISDYWVYTNSPYDFTKNEDGSYNVSVSISKKDCTSNCDESNTLKVFFSNEEKIASVAERVDEIIDEIHQKWYDVNDLGYINFLYTMNGNYDETSNIDYGLLYSNDLIKTIGNKNISYSVDNRMGNDLPYDTAAAGFMVIYYNDIAYGVCEQVGAQLRNIMYIPDETEDTNEAYIAAALKRIKEYFGNDVDVEITTYKKITDINDYAAFEATGHRGDFLDKDILDEYYNGMNNKLDMTYKITINGHDHYMLIEKDSSKMVKPLFNVEDELSNVKVSATSGNVPLDTNIYVKNIEKDSAEYKKIDGVINGDFSAIDISLYSLLKRANITKLENGNFLVTIPVDESLNGKTLTTYYLNDKNVLEEHDTTPAENGFVSFETDHFSTYILAEKQVVENVDVPATFDNVNSFVLLSVVSLIGVVGISLYFKKQFN